MNKLIKTLTKISDGDLLFAGYYEDKNHKSTHPARTWYGSFASQGELMHADNRRGYGIYVCVNKTRTNLRRNEEVVQYRAIFQDDDNGFTGTYPLEPSLVVQTSPGKYQRYWFIDPNHQPEDQEDWRSVQRKMVNWGADPNALDPVRVLRVPGFYNNKTSTSFEVKEIAGECTLYTWSELKEAFDIPEEPSDVHESTSEAGANYIDDAIKAILDGSNFNGSMTTLSQSRANRGDGALEIEMYLRGLMKLCPLSDPSHPDFKRWEQRWDHIGTIVKTALKKAKDVRDEPVYLNPQSEFIREAPSIPWPPGMLGQLARCAYNFQPFQNQTIAVVMALGVSSGMLGRKFNISNTGLNLYQTVLMESGGGKDAIQQFVERFFRTSDKFGAGEDFIGAKRFTSPKGILDSLKDRKSQICVFTEAGYLYKSGAGDQEGILRVILDLYTKSGQGSWSGKETYSAKENSIPALRAPALSIINEATPITFIDVLNKRAADATGEMARMNIFRMYGDKPLQNRNQVFHISPDVLTHYHALQKICLTAQYQEDPEAINIPVPDEFWEFSDYCVSQENKFRQLDPLATMMYTRMALKCLKLAALCAICNPASTDLSGAEPRVKVSPEDWQWALSVCETELGGLQSLMVQGGSDLDEVAYSIVMPVIVKILGPNPYNHPTQQMKPEYVKQQIVSYSCLSQVLKQNQRIKALGDNFGQTTGLRKVLKHMTEVGLLAPIDTDAITMVRRNFRSNSRGLGKNSSAHYKVTREFEALWNGLGTVMPKQAFHRRCERAKDNLNKQTQAGRDVFNDKCENVKEELRKKSGIDAFDEQCRKAKNKLRKEERERMARERAKYNETNGASES